MENTAIEQSVDSDRWLLNNGLVSDNVKNQLFFCGSIVHKDVQAVEVNIRTENKLVEYIVYVPSRLIGQIAKYNQLSTSKSLFGMWRFKKLLKKEGCLDFQKILSSFVTDYCGPKWTAKATIISFDSYVDGLEADDEDSRVGLFNQPPDNG